MHIRVLNDGANRPCCMVLLHLVNNPSHVNLAEIMAGKEDFAFLPAMTSSFQYLTMGHNHQSGGFAQLEFVTRNERGNRHMFHDAFRTV